MSTSDVNVKRQNDPQNRDPEKRVQPFLSPLLVAWIAVPLFCILLRSFVAVDAGLMWLIVWLDLFLFGVIGPLVAVGIGFRVSERRLPFVVWHVALTVLAFAVATSLLVLPGWERKTTETAWPDFAERLWWATVDVLTIPAYLVVIYVFASLAVVGSWLLYRIDAFRSAATGRGEEGGVGELLKRLRSAKVRKDTIVVDDVAIEATISHPGVPIAQLRSELPALDEHPGIVRGRSSLIPTGVGGESRLRMVHTDPHKNWRVWPGLSHPGGSYTDPIRTSYYSTGEVQWYSFVKTPAGYRSKVAPGFASTNDTFHGSQGMTGTGKSGDSAIENAEVLSRRNVQLIYIDTAKLLQNAGWCLDFCSLAAGSKSASGALFTALRRLGEYRSRVLGDAGFRNFTDEAAEATGLSWLHIFADEFDVTKQGEAIAWLATKGRSLGFRLSLTLPRATAKDMDADVRGAIGMWSQFGITQDYDAGFVLSDETLAAGANPESFGATTPGVHYLDRAPGIDPKMYPIDCRTYQTREDYADLRRAVEAARATFTPATWTEGEREVLGNILTICAPSVVRGGHLGVDDDPEAARPAETTSTKGPDMQQTMELEDGDDGADLLDDEPAVRSTAEEEAEFGPINPRELQPLSPPDGIVLKPEKPKVSPEQAVAEFDAALIRMAERSVREFTNADVRDEMKVHMPPSTCSARFTKLTEDESLNPPGLKIERLGGGRYLLVRLAEHGRDGARG